MIVCIWEIHLRHSRAFKRHCLDQVDDDIAVPERVTLDQGTRDWVTPGVPLASYCLGRNVWVSVSVAVDKFAFLHFGISVVNDL